MKTLFRALAALCLFASPVLAQEGPPQRPPCGPVAKMLGALGERWGEVPESVFVANNGLVLTLTVNRETGTWTLLGQNNADLMCMLNGGEMFDDASDAVKALAVPGSDA